MTPCIFVAWALQSAPTQSLGLFILLASLLSALSFATSIVVYIFFAFRFPVLRPCESCQLQTPNSKTIYALGFIRHCYDASTKILRRGICPAAYLSPSPSASFPSNRWDEILHWPCSTKQHQLFLAAQELLSSTRPRAASKLMHQPCWHLHHHHS